MAYINITIDTGAGTVTQANEMVRSDSSTPREGVVKLRNLMDALLAGAVDANIDLATTNVDPAVNAAGGGIDRAYVLK